MPCCGTLCRTHWYKCSSSVQISFANGAIVYVWEYRLSPYKNIWATPPQKFGKWGWGGWGNFAYNCSQHSGQDDCILFIKERFWAYSYPATAAFFFVLKDDTISVAVGPRCQSIYKWKNTLLSVYWHTNQKMYRRFKERNISRRSNHLIWSNVEAEQWLQGLSVTLPAKLPVQSYGCDPVPSLFLVSIHLRARGSQVLSGFI